MIIPSDDVQARGASYADCVTTKPTSARTSRTVVLVVALLILSACSSTGVSTESIGVSPDSTQATATSEPTDEVTAPAESTAPPSTVPTTAVPTTAVPITAVPTTVAPEPTHPGYADDFGESIGPIFASRCASCHNAGGPGSVHWLLEDVDDIAAEAAYVSAVVSSGLMPPWPASDLSPAFHDDRGLSADEMRALADWSTAGLSIDVPGDTPIVGDGLVGLESVDATLGPVDAYDGSPALVDDYRCLIYEPAVDEPAFLQGFNFVPDQTEVVHHVIGYAVPGDQRDRADALAGEDDGAGWECFGSSELDDDKLFIAWAPGQGATNYPDGVGLLVEPGDFFVLQLHYHFEIDAPADNSQLELSYGAPDADFDEIRIAEYLGPAEIPCMDGETGPLCDREAAMALALEKFGFFGRIGDVINNECGVTPADFASMTNGFVRSTCDLPVYETGEIVSIFGHEHELGSAVRLTLNPDTPEERILLDIPKWSFDWQYNYYPVESIVLDRDDTLRIECEWDRSLRDPKLEPSYVLWANGTNDEMCFWSITTRPA